jgi:thiamine-monophosphate kinase
VARAKRSGEFELIARYFAPLAKGFHGARGLKSDNAFLASDSRHDLVVKTDTIVSGVHFLADEKPELVAQRALRVCLSDLAAGGATPYAYQVGLSLERNWTERWIRGFARGLAADQRKYRVALTGGDTTQTPGPTTITVTAFGKVLRGRGIGRDGARAGDELWISGTIGDATLGLLVAQGKLTGAALEKRYRLPLPRTALGLRLRGLAHAAADVSDGLLADAGHIAEASGLAVTIERNLVPLSVDAKRVLRRQPSLWNRALAGGDDYELLIAVPVRKGAALQRASRAAGVKVTRIGAFSRGRGVRLTVSGQTVKPTTRGYTHF